MSSTDANAHRDDGRFLARLSLGCWVVCVVMLVMLGSLGALGLAVASLAALGGIASTAFAVRHAFLSRDLVSFLTLAASVPFALAACWFGRIIVLMWHFHQS